jgi:hypothetical protein
MATLTLEQVSQRTGIPVAELRRRQEVLRQLRRQEDVMAYPQQPPAPAPVPQFSPTGGPPKLQGQMRDNGL